MNQKLSLKDKINVIRIYISILKNKKKFVHEKRKKVLSVFLLLTEKLNNYCDEFKYSIIT